jgi:hypothetical protein
MNKALYLATLLVAPLSRGLFAFQTTSTKYGRAFAVRASRGEPLHMALTPVGPFCPFRSSAVMEMEPRMEQLQSDVPDFATEFSKIQLDMQMGNTPDPERLRKLADGIDQAVDQWEDLVTRLRISADFQTREYAKLTEAHLNTHGVSVESIKSMMRWQGGCMRALADNTPPPMPPPDLDLQAMMQQAEDPTSKPPPSMAAMQAAEAITANPFDPSKLESETIKDEYMKLVLNHSSLIQFGAKYDEFDALGKLAFLDEVEKIEDRWDAFFFRFKLMDALDKEYKQQCDQFLASMSMNEDDYRQLLKNCHQLMREDAERERNPMSS